MDSKMMESKMMESNMMEPRMMEWIMQTLKVCGFQGLSGNQLVLRLNVMGMRTMTGMGVPF